MYREGNMVSLQMSILIKYYGKSEMIALSRVVAQSILDIFPKEVKIQMKIKSKKKIVLNLLLLFLINR
ncbi:CamS family sex pheromone protein [Bacillus cereus]|uniref:CamS family sex pheromone protein n=1 Tax=Bacillus cereus TaxID=1396 RepID=UPI00380725E8